MRALTAIEVGAVAGGWGDGCEYPLPPQYPNVNQFLIDELFAYQTGRPSLFGVNPDLQLVPPPPVPG